MSAQMTREHQQLQEVGTGYGKVRWATVCKSEADGKECAVAGSSNIK